MVRFRRDGLLVSYNELSETDKVLNRGTSMETIKAMLSLGYEIRKPADR